MNHQINRNRIQYFLLILFIIAIGLFSRTKFIPSIIYPYLGDYLYCLMFYVLFGVLFPKKEPISIALLSIGLCFFIEILQLYKADWILAIRSYRLGGLILGHGFLWSDLLSYTLGGITGFVLELFCMKKG